LIPPALDLVRDPRQEDQDLGHWLCRIVEKLNVTILAPQFRRKPGFAGRLSPCESPPSGSLCIPMNHADILSACCLSSRRSRSFRSLRVSHSARETAVTVPTAATHVETVPHCTALILPSWRTARTVQQGPNSPKHRSGHWSDSNWTATNPSARLALQITTTGSSQCRTNRLAAAE
jgi:hypothetical protein